MFIPLFSNDFILQILHRINFRPVVFTMYEHAKTAYPIIQFPGTTVCGAAIVVCKRALLCRGVPPVFAEILLVSISHLQ